MDISRKKPSYPLTPALRQYLRAYDREVALPVSYDELRSFTGAFPLRDRAGHDTLWETVFYEPTALRELIRYVRPPMLRRWVRDGYGWVQPRLSGVARSALPPHLTVEYLEMTRGAIDFNRPGIPIVASLPSVRT